MIDKLDKTSIAKIEFNYLKSRSFSLKQLLNLKTGFYKLLTLNLENYHASGVLDAVLKLKSKRDYYNEFYYHGNVYSTSKAKFSRNESTEVPELNFFIKLYYNRVGRVTKVCKAKDYGKTWWLVPLKLKIK